MNFQQLQTFLAVCHHGSFSRAAREIGRSQPAVSRQVRQLEGSLGAPLLELIQRSPLRSSNTPFTTLSVRPSRLVKV